MKKSADSFHLPWEINPIWDVLTLDEKREISNKIELVHFKKNEVIHDEGQVPTHMMMLMSGKVRIYKEGNSQRHQIIRLLKPYEIFAYRAIFAGDTYNAAAAAFEPCVVMMLDRETFVRLVQNNNAFAFAILHQMATDLAVSQIQTVNLTQKHIRGRLAESILSLRDRYGVEDDGCTVNIQIGREDLANMSNMTTSNAIRTLSQFAQEGLVQVEGRKISIINLCELDRISRIG